MKVVLPAAVCAVDSAQGIPTSAGGRLSRLTICQLFVGGWRGPNRDWRVACSLEKSTESDPWPREMPQVAVGSWSTFNMARAAKQYGRWGVGVDGRGGGRQHRWRRRTPTTHRPCRWGSAPKISTLDPQPCNINPEPQARHPAPKTRSLPEILHPKSETCIPKPGTLETLISGDLNKPYNTPITLINPAKPQ